MASAKKTAVQKRDGAPAPEVQVLREGKGKLFPPGRMLIASPLEIGAIVNRVPEGCVVTLQQVREALAAKFKADYTCPMTTGIFLRILAEAAEEEGGSHCAYWRVVRTDGRLIDKLPGGEAEQAKRLRREGVALQPAGKTGFKLKDLSKHTWQLILPAV